MLLWYRYYRSILEALSSDPFYSRYVHLPPVDAPTPDEISSNPKFHPFFKDALGGMDGTQVASHPCAAERAASRNRKGFVSQNVLACSDFNLMFQYVLSGWEGSAADSTMYHDARLTDLPIPPGKFFLADAGFPACDSLLVPYRGVRYHLAEWGRASVR